MFVSCVITIFAARHTRYIWIVKITLISKLYFKATRVGEKDNKLKAMYDIGIILYIS